MRVTPRDFTAGRSASIPIPAVMHRLDIGMENNVYAPGCYIDCSHLSASDLDYRVISFAAQLGWTGDKNDLAMLEADWVAYSKGDAPQDYTDEEDFFISYQEALAYACDDAVLWLNENKFGPENVYWAIDDNSLYLWEDENENV